MKSSLPKPLHKVGGRTMIEHVLGSARMCNAQTVAVVVGVGKDAVMEALADSDVAFVHQDEQLGTGHAVRCATELFSECDGHLLVTCADTPLIRAETLAALLAEHERCNAAGTVLTADYDDPTGYGRVIRDAGGMVTSIVEHKDADEAQRAICEINAGIYVFRIKELFAALSRVQSDNAQGEYYLPDVIADFVSQNLPVAAVKAEDPAEVIGINDRIQLAEAESILRRRTNRALMAAGVTLIDPEAVYIDDTVTVGRDTIIWPGAVLRNGTTVGEGCTIGPQVVLDNARIGDRCEVKQGCTVTDAQFMDDVVLGPLAHIRAESILECGARVGSHTEVVRSRIGERTKCLHFSYIGDARIGPECNIGAGTITCNYDGVKKYPTIIGRGVFVGSDAVLVAPVTLGDGSFVAAGSVVNQDVPPEALAIGRARQENREGWAQRRRQMQGEGRGS